MPHSYVLRLPALRIQQAGRDLYCFAVDGKDLSNFAAVARIRRAEDTRLHGYQRPEVTAHIRGIRRYLESGRPILPNAIVLAFDSTVKFEHEDGGAGDSEATPGTLVVPVDEDAPEADKPAWIVDGQQRTAALRDANINNFPVFVVAFGALDEADQRSQFILVNSTKPLPKGLIHELLPFTQDELPLPLVRRRLPAALLQRLNHEPNSPFFGRISTPTHPDGMIKDNGVLRMIENSLYDGALYQYRDPTSGDGDEDAMFQHLQKFWNTVVSIFPDAWDKPPRHSRLTHGVGIRSVGYLMDTLTDSLPSERAWKVRAALTQMKPHCAWTEGTWQFGAGQDRKWNALQNTPNDVKLLTDFLIRLGA